MVYEKELSFKVIGYAMEVYNELGYGFLEKVYENALIEILKEKRLDYCSQAPIKVKFRGKVVGEYIADILISDKIIIELKTIEKISGIHEAQLLNYLKATGIKVGLLINFSPNKLEFKKMVF